MQQSTHYNLNLVEGSDLVNPLIQDVPNYEAIDTAMYNNKVATIGKATELVSGTVHTLTRADSDTDVFRFTATSNFNAGETFTVDAVQVTALTPSGETLSSGCYIIGSEVLCALRDTLLTVYVSGTQVADNALALDGHPAEYFGTASAVESAQATATASGVLAQSVQTQVTELNENLTQLKEINNPNNKSQVTKIPLSISSGTSVDNLGGCYYYKKGSKVHIHLGFNNVSANTQYERFITLPDGFNPSNTMAFNGIDVRFEGVALLEYYNNIWYFRAQGTGAIIDAEYDVLEFV